MNKPLAVEGAGHVLQQPDAPLYDLPGQLHGGNSVLQEATNGVVPLKDSDPMAGLVELLGAGQSGRTGTDHGYLHSGADGWRLGLDPAVLERVVDDGTFDVLDGHRWTVYAQNAGGFAWSRTHTASKFRKVTVWMNRELSL